MICFNCDRSIILTKHSASGFYIAGVLGSSCGSVIICNTCMDPEVSWGKTVPQHERVPATSFGHEGVTFLRGVEDRNCTSGMRALTSGFVTAYQVIISRMPKVARHFGFAVPEERK